jgi:1,4-dihydroxy-2-naphthoate octaprenyltransferase
MNEQTNRSFYSNTRRADDTHTNRRNKKPRAARREDTLDTICRCALCAIALMGGLGAGICILQHDWSGALGATATAIGAFVFELIAGED